MGTDIESTTGNSSRPESLEKRTEVDPSLIQAEVRRRSKASTANSLRRQLTSGKEDVPEPSVKVIKDTEFRDEEDDTEITETITTLDDDSEEENFDFELDTSSSRKLLPRNNSVGPVIR